MMVVEAVCVVLGEKDLEWGVLRRRLRTKDFIPRLLEFDARTMTAKSCKKLEKSYLSNPEFTFERVNHASKVCGPMVKWVLAQYQRNLVLRRIEPLESVLAELKKEIELASSKLVELVELEQRLAEIEEGHAMVIRFACCTLCLRH